MKHARVFTLTAPSMVFWMQVTRPLLVSVNARSHK
jgi:hypothetical protein